MLSYLACVNLNIFGSTVLASLQSCIDNDLVQKTNTCSDCLTLELLNLIFLICKHSPGDIYKSNNPVPSGPMYEEVKLQEIEMTKMNENVAYGVN